MGGRHRVHVERAAARFVETLMNEEPAILVEGPRGSGKSTLLRGIAAARGGSLLDLDDPATVRLVAEDPSGTVGGRPGLVFIDEYERVPEVLSVVKWEVDRDGRPGRFLLAGSVSGRLLPLGSETPPGEPTVWCCHPYRPGRCWVRLRRCWRGYWPREHPRGSRAISPAATTSTW